MYQRSTNKLVKMVDDFKSNPISFFRFQWPKETTWPKQHDICKSIIKHKRTYVPACHSSSKTHTSARIAIWWLSCFKDSIVITTAPTFTQVEMILWGNMRAAYNSARSQLEGTMLPSSPMWKISDNHYGLGLSVKEPDRFQGFHTPSGKALIIIDEGSGVPDSIYEATNALLTSDNSRLLVIGNPLRVNGSFYNAIKKGGDNVIKISGYEAVKYSKDIPGLISQQYLDEQKALFDAGNNPLYEPRCLGEPPTGGGTDNIINIKDLDIALTNPLIIRGVKLNFFSIDWAVGGKNETVIQHWDGRRLLEQLTSSKKEPADTCGTVVAWIRAREGKDIFHDNCGVGKVYGSLLKEVLGPDYRVHDLDSSTPLPETEAYYNNRALYWFNAQKMIHEGGVSLLNDPILKEQLLIPWYFRNSRGRLLVASKEDMQSDFNLSPDRADACVYGLWGCSVLEKENQMPINNPSWKDMMEQKDDKEAVGFLGLRNS